MRALDRFLTVLVTATLTSAAWILFGSLYASRWLDADPATPTPAKSPPVADADTGADADLVIPVVGVRAADLSDTFADARGGDTRLHEAIDIMAPRGRPVVAAAPGTIERLFRSVAGGKTVYQRSADRRTIYYYAHLDAYAPGLTEGMDVRQGQRLGTVGSSGNAAEDAPHLHFAIMRTTPEADWWEPASAINPYPLLAGGAR